MAQMPNKTKGDNKNYPLLEEVVLGQVSVDSGTMLVIAPCHAEHPEKWDLHGTVFSTTTGDGTYDVIGLKNEKGKIDAILIPLDIYGLLS